MFNFYACFLRENEKSVEDVCGTSRQRFYDLKTLRGVLNRVKNDIALKDNAVDRVEIYSILGSIYREENYKHIYTYYKT